MNGEDWLLTRPPCNNVNIYHGKIIPSKSTTNPPSSQPLSLSYEWDHPIVCTQSFPQLGGPLCLFTSASFALGRGISIITTPQIADEFLTLPAVVDAHLSSQFNSNTNATNGHREGAESRPWKSVAIRGRGMGVVATRPLTFGTLLTAYTPLLLVLHSAPQIINPPELEPFFRRAAAQLPVTSRDMLLSLARTSGLDEYMIHDIIQTNLFEFEIAGEQHMAVFPETARINHDCAPNSQYHIDASQFTHYVHAVRPIDNNEEITITYTYPIVPRSQRAASLQTFRFNCTCKRCQTHDSDTHVERIQTIEKALSDWSSSSQAKKAVIDSKEKTWGLRAAQELIALYEEEGLHAMLGRAYGYVALEYSGIKEENGVQKYTVLAVQYLSLMQGEDGADVINMRGLQNDMEKHWSWGRRL